MSFWDFVLEQMSGDDHEHYTVSSDFDQEKAEKDYKNNSSSDDEN